MAGSMNEKFKKYWGEPQKMNKMIFISSIFDPCNKLDYVPFVIADIFGKEVGKKLCSKVKKYMNKLFEYYVKKSPKSSLHVPFSPTSSNNSSSISSVSGCGNFVNRGRMRTKQQFKKHKEVSGSSGNNSELRRYLEEDSDEFDILIWWKVNEPRFPILAEMVRDVVASECAFSTGGRVLDPFRSSLTHKIVKSLICVQDWLRSEFFPINIEKYL
uniref:HAT C-terminal dimerisation domain-containing protein n=1 Tax=Solanum lycopersicum TaxID=4081 RepID=A0A3Q7HAJ8_SOLLC